MATKVFITTESGDEFLMGTLKDTNPKDAIGSDKLPLHLWPETATLLGSLGLLDGALKYGRGNYRAIGVKASIYVDACKRHLNAWFEGEDHDPDSGLPHLAHALACLAILVDADAADKLTDDRQVSGGYRKMVEQMTPHVTRLRSLHADKAPKHYTIKDRPAPEYGRSLGDHAETALLRQLGITKTHNHFGADVVKPATVYEPPRFDADEIEEMCRLAKSSTVTLPID